MSTETLRQRFESLFIPEPNSGCWLWVGSDGAFGYGAISSRGKNLRANRASWLIYRGEIPDGMYVCHRCDVPCCVNPNHLFLGTPQENVDDRNRKGRTYRFPIGSHCPNGHEYVATKRSNGALQCMECAAEIQMRRKMGIGKSKAERHGALHFEGRTYSVTALARIFGISQSALSHRIAIRGVEKALAMGPRRAR